MVSNLGRIKGLDRVARHNMTENQKVYGRFLSPYITRNGYIMVNLCDGRGKAYRTHSLVHRIVAEAFIPRKNGKDVVNHKDGNRANNCVDNLEWCTTKENVNDARKRGALVLERPVIGTNKIDGTVLLFPSIMEAATKTGAHNTQITSCCRGRRKDGGRGMKPILFSTPMVQAILSGKKSMTRRIIKGVPSGANFLDISENMAITCVDRNGNEYPKDVDGLYATFEHDGCPEFPVFKALYQPGDILWVRETWRPLYDRERVHATEPHHFDFAASWSPEHFENSRNPRSSNGGKWKPSIHMPREAARIFLRVTGVSVERICQITCADCRAEGIDGDRPMGDYHDLWNTLNAKSGYSWESNPWVFVYNFERTEKPEA